MKKHFNKKSIFIMSVALLLLISVGTTLAYVFTSSGPLENTFTPSQVSCSVVENGKEPVSGSRVDINGSKNNVRIQNTGDTDAYIRVAVVVNWMSADGTQVWATKPKDTEYSIEYNNDGWVNGGDGFYYYKTPVAPGYPTDILITSASLNTGITPPNGYYLSIEIVASAIQAKPASVVEGQWGVTVTNGEISTQGG